MIKVSIYQHPTNEAVFQSQARATVQLSCDRKQKRLLTIQDPRLICNQINTDGVFSRNGNLSDESDSTAEDIG